MADKAAFDHVDGGAGRRLSEKHEHGDRALSVIGEERVTVTAEEVRDASLELSNSTALRQFAGR